MKTIEIQITAEEKAIVLRLSKGDMAETVGKDLGYKKGTFANKMKEIRGKYGVSNSTELVAYFLREGIIN